MAGPRDWMGKILLRTPTSVRAIRNVPVLGDFVHRVSHRVLPNDEKIWAQIEAGPSKGLWLELNPRTGQSYLRGDAEAAVQEVLAQRLRPGMIFYDLGANIGLFSLLAARLVGTNGEVFSFEPDAEVAGRLRRNIARNGFSNVTVIEAGVWSSSREMPFLAASGSSPDRGTGTVRGNEISTAEQVIRCVSLDDFVRDAPLPDALKCDVEGAEVEVFRGAKEVLIAHRPWVLCEMHSETNDQSCREVLQELGYIVEGVDSNHILATPSGVRDRAAQIC
jgi:FkbM family methyltransferase